MNKFKIVRNDGLWLWLEPATGAVNWFPGQFAGTELDFAVAALYRITLGVDTHTVVYERTPYVEPARKTFLGL